MGLKDLKSTLDASILGVEGNTVANATPDANFNTLNGTSNSPFSSDDHMVDLLSQNVSSTNTGETYQNAPTNSPYQDIDGQPGPQSQLPVDDASQKHIDSLQVVPGGDSNSPYQDLDGVQGPQFQRPTDIASQVHESSLALVPGGSQNSSYQDLDGAQGPQFDLGKDSTLQQDSLLSSVPGGSQNSPYQDMDGGLPLSGEYLNNLPS
ncbi:hypothetical protein N9Z72_02415 [Akkermansiaceae bacterium]|nr:hypothetical protein [Akkermansiaceae bacterium]